MNKSKANPQDKHTPGPWIVEGIDILGGHGESCHIATVALLGVGERHPTIQSNARLIAAAPELLAACKNAIQVFDNEMHRSEDHESRFFNGEDSGIARLKAAISKAEGRG